MNQLWQQAMLKDVKRMIAIRKQYSDILAAEQISTAPNIVSVEIEGNNSEKLPTPYIRWNDKKEILIAANPTNEPVEIKIKLLQKVLGLK